jgi:hypothetical protein
MFFYLTIKLKNKTKNLNHHDHGYEGDLSILLAASKKDFFGEYSAILPVVF